MNAPAGWVGVIVSDLHVATTWWTDRVGLAVVERGRDWCSLAGPRGGIVELVRGDPTIPGSAFPSYGADPGPPVLPGFAVPDADAAAEGWPIARSLPGWVVIEAPGGLRIVLTEGDVGEGLGGFALACTDAAALTDLVAALGAPASVAAGELDVGLVLAADRDAELVDPDGTTIVLSTDPARVLGLR